MVLIHECSKYCAQISGLIEVFVSHEIKVLGPIKPKEHERITRSASAPPINKLWILLL